MAGTSASDCEGDMTAHLTPRETEIHDALSAGETPKEIAVRLWLSRETVKTHIRRLLAKSGYHSVWEMRFSEALKERDAEIVRLRRELALYLEDE